MADRKVERKGLGKGLASLMADVPISVTSDAEPGRPLPADRMVPVEKLQPNPDQPRRSFTEEALGELAASIEEKGIIQPLIVRQTGDDTYEIVAGERRWRAAQMVRLHEVPVLVRDYTDTEVLEVAIIENVQRADLNPVEEAAGFRQLMDRFGHTQEKIAEALGKSRSHIANSLRLLSLPEEVQTFLSNGDLSAGHARALITTDDPIGLAKTVIAKGLSVRETERLAKAGAEPKKEKTERTTPEKDADTKALEDDLSAATGLKIRIDHKPGGEAGRVSIDYVSLDQLDEVCRMLSRGR